MTAPDRCPRCDRAECERRPSEARYLRVRNLNATDDALIDGKTLAAWSDACDEATIDCTANAVDWRARCLAAESECDALRAEVASERQDRAIDIAKWESDKRAIERLVAEVERLTRERDEHAAEAARLRGWEPPADMCRAIAALLGRLTEADKDLMNAVIAELARLQVARLTATDAGRERDAETVRDELAELWANVPEWFRGKYPDSHREAHAALDRLAARSGGKGGGQ